ncbi:hypothetical protein BKA56DRAFT_594366 [Ilyonectria sp. MPI-CAGE-AT-0026]|nr:hypothetical protein BKA56DRAFT_594366 [Ilyonectria sp. MPI-CAGE-AT-0026]
MRSDRPGAATSRIGFFHAPRIQSHTRPRIGDRDPDPITGRSPPQQMDHLPRCRSTPSLPNPAATPSSREPRSGPQI